MKMILIFMMLFSALQAQDKSAKVVYDLTTKSLSKFEKQILSGLVFQKTYYQNSLKELEVAVVIHGEAYRFFLKNINGTIYKNDKKLVASHDALIKRITSIANNYDVKFLICAIGVKNRHLKENNILDFVKLIPSSTTGLIDKQNEGYAYLPVGD